MSCPLPAVWSPCGTPNPRRVAPILNRQGLVKVLRLRPAHAPRLQLLARRIPPRPQIPNLGVIRPDPKESRFVLDLAFNGGCKVVALYISTVCRVTRKSVHRERTGVQAVDRVMSHEGPLLVGASDPIRAFSFPL